jgi:hypothetical protein
MTALPRHLWLLALRVIPRRLHTRSAAAALRVTHLAGAERAELARNLRRMLEPKTAA